MLRNALPERVDPRILARDNVVLEGTVALARFERIGEYLASSDGQVDVRLQFHLGRNERVVILGKLRSKVAMECQYCLEQVEVEIDAEVDLVASHSDDQVRELSETGDALLLTGELVPLVALIEDDLILSLPMVARHGGGECIEKLEYQSGDLVETRRPFAALAKLKGTLGHGSDK